MLYLQHNQCGMVRREYLCSGLRFLELFVLSVKNERLFHLRKNPNRTTLMRRNTNAALL